MTALSVFITLLYPLVIWLSYGHVEPRLLALLLVSTAVTRLIAFKINRSAYGWLISALLLAGCAIAWNALLPLQLYPVFINIGMFILFGYSLLFSTPIIERIARLREPNLPPAAIAYTRRVTQVWCLFFLFNGTISLLTVLYAPPEIWFIYNGVIAYLLIGLLFGGEYLVRLRFKRQQHE